MMIRLSLVKATLNRTMKNATFARSIESFRMRIEQFEDKYLSQYSYAVLSESERKVILIDPSRDPEPYYRYAKEHDAEITGVIETHSHADFVSSHAEISQTTGAPVYASKHMPASFAFGPLDDGDRIQIGEIALRTLYTPGHSNDSISIVLEHEEKDRAIFTGDTLFIGDTGRPDLRENQENAAVLREELAEKMYFSLRDKLMALEDHVVVYPGHGAGSLCGKSLSKARSSTIGNERISNRTLREMTPQQFIMELTTDQPFIPAYFPYDVSMNLKGAPLFSDSTSGFGISSDTSVRTDKDVWVVDVRASEDYRSGHLKKSVNIMDGEKFETWLGTIILPGEPFYLAGASTAQLQQLIRRTASIGYETQIVTAFVVSASDLQSHELDLDRFKAREDAYTILDVRNPAEVREKPIFRNSISIPLPELRNRIAEVPADKPVVVHCAAGYRSAAASSLLDSELKGTTEVFDLGEAIRSF